MPGKKTMIVRFHTNSKEWSLTVRGFNAELRDKTIAAIRSVAGECNAIIVNERDPFGEDRKQKELKL